MHIKNEVENIYNRIATETPNVNNSKEECNGAINKTNNSESSLQKTKSRVGNETLGKIELDLLEFQKLGQSLKQNLIIYTINKVLGNARNIEKTNIDDIIKMCGRNIGNKYMYPNKNLKILIKNKKIIFMPLP